MAASSDATTAFRATDVRPLFRTDLIPGNNRPYAVTRDGHRFILTVPVEARNPESTTGVLNWPSDVER